MAFPITAATLGIFLIALQQILMLGVGLHRTAVSVGVGVGVGNGGDKTLERKIRRHGNLAENAALFLILLALAEMQGASGSVIFWFAAAFAVARLAHALSFSSLRGSHQPSGLFGALRGLGAFGTILSGLGVSGYLAFLLYGDITLGWIG